MSVLRLTWPCPYCGQGPYDSESLQRHYHSPCPRLPKPPARPPTPAPERSGGCLPLLLVVIAAAGAIVGVLA
jgi:hypothetical protein